MKFENKKQLMKLESINELLNYLNPNKKEVKRSREAMQSLDVSLLNIQKYCFWESENYTRNLISKTEAYELYVCCWEPNQESTFHDLNGQAGWIKVVKGNLQLSILKKDAIESNELSDGEVANFESKTEIYSLKNNSKKRAISIHLVSYPISFYNVLQGKGNDVSLINKTYYSINGNLIKLSA